jgi:NAD(P)-dependent dehydrogenase (short-subunit alcohol dehydrogenase family)
MGVTAGRRGEPLSPFPQQRGTAMMPAEPLEPVPGAVYVVLGATGGIGSALSRRLAASDARLLLAARDVGKLEELAASLGAERRAVDATRFEQVEACVARAVELFGRVDGVANCVGSVLLKPAHLTKEDEFNGTLALNLGSAFAAVRAGARAMMKAGGSIVLVSSAAARVGLVNHEAIAAAKGGVSGLVLAAAATYARYNIRVNAVAPGLVRTAATESITRNEVSERVSIAMHAAGRLGTPRDVASVMAWLLNPRNDWVTGQVLGIDGGLSTVRTRVSA